MFFLETQNLHKPCHEGCWVGGSLSGVLGHPGWAQPRTDQPPVPPSLQLLCRCILSAGIYCPHGDTDQHQQGCLGGDRGASLLQAMPPQQHDSERTRETGIVKCAWQSVPGAVVLEGLESSLHSQSLQQTWLLQATRQDSDTVKHKAASSGAISFCICVLWVLGSLPKDSSTSQSIKRRCKIPEKWHFLAIVIHKVYKQLLSKQTLKCHWLASFWAHSQGECQVA